MKSSVLLSQQHMVKGLFTEIPPIKVTCLRASTATSFCFLSHNLLPSMKKLLCLQAADMQSSACLLQLAPNLLREIWPQLAQALRLPEADSLRSATASCCLSSMRADYSISNAIATICLPGIPLIVGLEQGKLP